MSRRARRERPATPAEQAQFDRFAELAQAAIEATGEQRANAVQRMRRQVDRVRDPGNLSNVPRRDLLDHLRQLHPDRSPEARCDRNPAGSSSPETP